MKRLFISDLHVGDYGSKFRDAIKVIEKEKPQELYLIGDVIDLWKDNLDTIENSYPSFFYFLQRITASTHVIYILGNHDESLDLDKWFFKSIQFEKSLVIEIGKRRARIFHGHEYDDLVIKYYPISRFLTFLHKIFLRAFHIDLRILNFSLSSKRYSKKFRESVDKIRGKAVEENRVYEIVIMGHTHLPEKVRIGQTEYINTGDWLNSFTYILEEDGNLKLKKLNL